MKVQDPEPGSHCVHFFEPSQFPAAQIADFLHQGLNQGEGAILIASVEHASQIGARIEELGRNVGNLHAAGLWEVTEVGELIRALESGIPTATVVEYFINSTVRPAQERSKNRRVRIYGELVDAILSRLADTEASLIVERYGNRLVSEGAALIYCGYSTNAFPDASFAKPFMKLCHMHDRVHNGLSDPDDWRFQMAAKMATL